MSSERYRLDVQGLLTLYSETIKRVLSLPPDTNIIWRSHDESIAQRSAADEARQQKSNQPAGSEKRRTTSYMGDSKERLMS